MTLKEKWTDVLQDIVDSYNNSIHRSIGRKPTDVTRENASELREEENLKMNKAKRRGEKEKNDLKVGDSVRISKDNFC